MLLNFFPSKYLAIYMARMFVLRIVTIATVLTLVLLSLDLLGEAGRILAYPGNGQAEILDYVGLRTPGIVDFILPFTVLLSTLLTLATLNQHSEVIAMKAAGLSAHQVLAPLGLAALGVAIATFLFAEMVVAPSQSRLTQWERVEFGPIPPESNIRTDVWVRQGPDLVNAAVVQGSGTAVRLRDIAIYRRTASGLSSIIKAAEGRYTGDQWVLEDISTFTVASGETSRQPRLTLGAELRPDQFTLTSVDPDGMAFWDLRRAITDLQEAGRPTDKLEAAYWHKISGPLSAILMPLLGAVAAFGLARSGQLFLRAVIGMALGFAFFVADNFALAMGNIGAYPPLLAAWSPFVLFLLIGETVLIRTEE